MTFETSTLVQRTRALAVGSALMSWGALLALGGCNAAEDAPTPARPDVGVVTDGGGQDQGRDAGPSEAPDAGWSGAPDARAPLRDAGLPIDASATDASATDASEGESPHPCELGMEWIDLPLRVHFMQSDVAALTSAADLPRFERDLEAANVFWEPACIRFTLESHRSMTARARGEQAFLDAVGAGDGPTLAQALSQTTDRSQLLDPGWNIIVIRDFGAPAGGRYFGSLGGAFVAEVLLDGTPVAPMIHAHELGHSFGLEHYEGAESETNLMRSGGGVGEPAVGDLTVGQIAQARAQAATGDPR